MSAIDAANLPIVRGTSSTDVLRYTWQSSALVVARDDLLQLGGVYRAHAVGRAPTLAARRTGRTALTR